MAHKVIDIAISPIVYPRVRNKLQNATPFITHVNGATNKIINASLCVKRHLACKMAVCFRGAWTKGSALVVDCGSLTLRQ